MATIVNITKFQLMLLDLAAEETEEDAEHQRRKRILVIGDVHGCIDELQSLIQKSTKEHNSGIPFQAIVLVGDLCNKGPQSAKVINYVRKAALEGRSDVVNNCNFETKYDWVHELSDEDVAWMSNLPYTITIPRTMLVDGHTEQDIIIVHAGLDPTIDGGKIDRQDTTTMTTLRDVTVNEDSIAWAKVWQGPQLVIFGHDALMGLYVTLAS